MIFQEHAQIHWALGMASSTPFSMAAVLHKAGGVSKRSTKPSYDATISSWAAIKIKGEAWMYSLGFINALRKPEQAQLRVRGGPEQAQLRVRGGPEQNTTTPSASTRGSGENEKDYLIMAQDGLAMSQHRDGTNILGPFNAGTILDMLEEGHIDRDTAYIQYAPPGFSKPFWTPISGDIEHDLLRRYRASMRVSPIDLPNTQVPAVVEVKQEDYFNPKIQEQAYYEIVGMVSEETDTSRALLVQIDKKFGGVRHGGDLWSWLDERATGHADSEEGLIDANEARREVDEYFFPECKITTEMLTVEAGKFENIYTRQPKERQGICAATCFGCLFRSCRPNHSWTSSIRLTPSTSSATDAFSRTTTSQSRCYASCTVSTLVSTAT